MRNLARKSFRLSTGAIVIALALVFAVPASALAQAGDPVSDPTASQYQAPVDRGEGPVDPAPPSDPQSGLETVALTSSGTGSTESGTLPFTGFDAAVVGAVALLLGATGLVLRRMTAVR